MARQKPRQDRASKTVEYIAEAFIQVLDTTHTSKFTTNHIAERAGVSIGTVYRYFPDKGAILRFVARREMKMASNRVRNVIETSSAVCPRTFLEDVVTESMSAFGARRNATHHVRALAQKDEILVTEMRSLRHSVASSINVRLCDMEPTQFRMLSDVELHAAGEAFGHVVMTIGTSHADAAADRDMRADLILALVLAFSSRDRG